MSIQCANCGFTFKNNEEAGQPCSKCGSLDRELQGSDEGKGHEFIKEERFDPFKKHKHKSVYDLEQGKKIGKNGKLVDVKKIKDREHSNEPHSYIETVKDENGKIIVDKESLTL